jgi:hypothetical protein
MGTSAAGSGGIQQSGGRAGTGGLAGTGGTNLGGATSATGGSANGGTNASGGSIGSGGKTTVMGGNGGLVTAGGASGQGGATGGSNSAGGTIGLGGNTSAGGLPQTGGAGASARTGGMTGTTATGGATGGSAGTSCSGPIATFTGALADGIAFMDDKGDRVNAHGGGIIKEGDTYYMHGEYFLSTTTDNDFNGFSMYSSKDLATWKWEKMILPQQADGDLGPKRKGERPHIIKCPSTGEFVLYAHAADETYQVDKEVVYATSATVNGDYKFQGRLTNSSGTIASHSDMSAVVDGDTAYVITESAHLYTLSTDCHSWLKDTTFSTVNGTSGGGESPTLFKAGSTYYWIMSNKTGWRANNNFYSTASAITGPWTYQGYIAPVTDPSNTISDERTWLSQSTWVTPVVGCAGTTYVYWGDHWNGTESTSAPGKHNDLTTYVFQPLVFTGTAISMPTYLATWKLDVGAGTWSQ